MSKNEMYKLIESTGLEYKLEKITKEMQIELVMNEVYMIHIDEKYEDKLRDMELIQEVRRRMTNILRIINKINEIEEKAIMINNHDLMWSCECKKSKLIQQMELLRSKYDL